MNHLENFLSWATLLCEIVLCGFVFTRKVHRILPLFATYVYAFCACSVLVLATYEYFGFNSEAAYYAFWVSTYIYAAFRSLAIAELCRYELGNYRGIWALTWRLLAVLSVLLIVRAGADAWGQPKGIAIFAITLGRDLALASVAIIAVLFLIRSYYGLSLDYLQRWIAAGICLSCVVDGIDDTILRNSFTGNLYGWFQTGQNTVWWPLVRQVEDLWSTAHLAAFMFAMGMWCYALRKPLQAPVAQPELLPASVYHEVSPAINMRLSAFNNRLLELLKP